MGDLTISECVAAGIEVSIGDVRLLPVMAIASTYWITIARDTPVWKPYPLDQGGQHACSQQAAG